MSAAARLRYTLVAGATAVVIGAGVTAVGLTRQAGADAGTTVPRSARQPLVAATSAAGPGQLADEAPPSPRATTATATAAPDATPAPTSGAPRSASARPTRTKTRSPARPAPTRTTVATAAPQTGGTVLEQVLAHINAARETAGRTALSLDPQLSRAAAVHTQLMIDGCGLAHQCPGESGLGARFSAQGVQWSSAGENIGYGSSGATDAAQIRAANSLTDSMLAEVPPNDGHRRNLLNTSFTRIGLSVVRDDKGVTWMTQDFVG